MDGFESMFDMDRDGELNNAERALEYEFLARAEAGDGDVDWDKDPFEDDDDLLRQVIVNTHSPILLRWLKEEYNDKDNGVSIWFSKLISSPIEIEGNRRSIRITRISTLTKSFQLTFSEAENKMTIADAITYLNTENKNHQL